MYNIRGDELMEDYSKYKKKIKILSQDSLPAKRTERFIALRNMINTSREKFARSVGVSAHSVASWENVKFGGLSLDGAKRIIKLAATKGVKCSLDWLVHGLGIGPVINELSIKDLPKLPEYIASGEELFVIQEMGAFYQLFNKIADVVTMKIPDDGMLPHFAKGDYVAGLRRKAEDINTLLGQMCIVELDSPNKERLLRRLTKGDKINQYTLVCDNLQPKESVSPVLYDIKLLSAAPVVRHYKLDGTLDLTKMPKEETEENKDSSIE